MGIINSDANTLLRTIQNVQKAADNTESARASIMQKYQQIGAGWNDKKYRDLGNVVTDCTKALNSVQIALLKTQKSLVSLAISLQEYESTRLSGGGMGGSGGAAYGAVSGGGSAAGGSAAFSGRNLSQTQQQIVVTAFNGRDCTVFDHPFDPNPGRICNQGSAYPTGPQETCGCCSSGTIINRAGGSTNEHDIVNFAWNNHLCDNDGRTSASTISEILTRSGVPSSDTSGTSLSDLAAQVEQGHGIIVAVDARRFDPNFYNRHGGHALVLESVIRDAQSGEILEYVVADSNRSDSVSAVRRVSAHRMERAFRAMGHQSITTDNIIW